MMPIAWERKWGLIRHHRISPIEYDEKWTLRDMMEAMVAKALVEDAETLQANESMRRMKEGR